jgi:hypothetical protein
MMLYRRVDGFSGNLRYFSILLHIFLGGFPHVLFSFLVRVVKLLCPV